MLQSYDLLSACVNKGKLAVQVQNKLHQVSKTEGDQQLETILKRMDNEDEAKRNRRWRDEGLTEAAGAGPLAAGSLLLRCAGTNLPEGGPEGAAVVGVLLRDASRSCLAFSSNSASRLRCFSACSASFCKRNSSSRFSLSFSSSKASSSSCNKKLDWRLGISQHASLDG